MLYLHLYSVYLFYALWSIIYFTSSAAFAFQGRIVNGTQANEGEFPFVVSLRRASSNRHSCGATLLNRAWVLTAAHCVNRAKPTAMNVQFGSLLLDRNSSKVMNVSKIFVHEGYAPQEQYKHDIALLKLLHPIEFDAKVRAVRLPEMESATPENSSAVLLGWGLNATGGDIQKHLQKVQLQIFSDEECSARHEVQLHATNICAGVPEGGKGQCSGDSGGPLLVNGTQVGVVSWSRKPCTIAPYPGVFTEVSAYMDWIIRTIGKETLESDDKNESNEANEQLISGNLIIVSLRRADNNAHFCAGTIISTSWVLTAAHCFIYHKRAEEVLVQYGSIKLSPQKPKLVAVHSIIMHEGFSATLAIHDIALIKLSQPVMVKEFAVFSNISAEKNVLDLVGWGLNKTGGQLQNSLQKLQMRSLPNTKCQEIMKAPIYSTNLCAEPAEGSNKGHCSGDSGGPLLLEHIYQIGIISWSFKPCANSPGVFTHVGAYVNWIVKHIQ